MEKQSNRRLQLMPGEGLPCLSLCYQAAELGAQIIPTSLRKRPLPGLAVAIRELLSSSEEGPDPAENQQEGDGERGHI